MSLRSQMRYMNPYDIHKALVNEYILQKPGDTKLLKRDRTNDRTDLDVIRQNHKFLWSDDTPDTWEAQFAKKYYDKLFKEYCIGDLSRYKENKIALRWRIEQEVVIGKGQFICGSKTCNSKEQLRTWEVNFAYKENEEKKNALVKIRLCPDCSTKLNYYSKKREVKRLECRTSIGDAKKKHKRKKSDEDFHSSAQAGPSNLQNTNIQSNVAETTPKPQTATEDSPWENIKPIESKSREEEMEDYLQELLL